MPEAQKRAHKGPVQDPAHGAHLRHPVEADRHAKAAEFHKANGDEAEHARSKNLEKWTRERQVHNLKALPFIDSLGLSHDVTPSTVTYNDALNYVAKVLHERQHASEGNPESAKSEFARAHQHLRHVKGTRTDEGGNVVDPNEPHVDPALLDAPRDHAAEVIAHLGLTDAAQIVAAKALFAS